MRGVRSSGPADVARQRVRRVPLRLALCALAPTVALTLAASVYPALFVVLRRDPVALARGEIWRLATPALIQADLLDGRWLQTGAVWLLVAVVLSVAQRALGVKRALLLYVLGALVGHAIGHLWQPYGAGCSVAGCGVLGGLAVWLVRARVVQVRIGAAFWLVAGVVATGLRDIHGPPLVVGALAGVFLVRSVPLPRALA